MKKLVMALAIAVVVLTMAPTAKADSIGPNCGSCNGGIYTLTYSGAPISSTSTTQTFQITLTIDTSGVAAFLAPAVPVAIDAVAIKVSSSASAASIVAAPGGIGNWLLVPGGINAGGCSESGGGFECADWIASGAGAAIGGILQWTFDVTMPTGSLFTGLNAASIKARYVGWVEPVWVPPVPARGNKPAVPGYWIPGYWDKVGALVSENITLQRVPEPGTMALLGAGLLGLAALRHRLL